MKQRVAAVTALTVGLAQAIIGLLAAFGVEMTTQQINAIIGALGVVIAFIGAWLHPDVPIGPTQKTDTVPE